MVGQGEAMQHAFMRSTVRAIHHVPHRVLIVVTLAFHIAWLLVGAGTAGAQSGAAAVAPTGQLRVAVNVGNPVLAVKDAASGEVRGVAVDLGRALAAKLGVPVALVEYPSV